jgi:hypothetical protein
MSMSAPFWDGGGGYWYDIMSVMGAGGTEGYIAESLDPQEAKFDFRGGGATTAMNR